MTLTHKGIVYAHEDEDGNIPILITEHGDGLQVEMRWGAGQLNGCTFHRQVSLKEAVELKSALEEFIERKLDELEARMYKEGE